MSVGYHAKDKFVSSLILFIWNIASYYIFWFMDWGTLYSISEVRFWSKLCMWIVKSNMEMLWRITRKFACGFWLNAYLLLEIRLKEVCNEQIDIYLTIVTVWAYFWMAILNRSIVCSQHQNGNRTAGSLKLLVMVWAHGVVG